MSVQFAAMRRSASCAGRIPSFRSILISTSTFVTVALFAASPSAAQTAPQEGQAAKDRGQLPPINVAASRPKRHARAKKSGAQTAAPPQPSQGSGAPPLQLLAGIPMTPLNGVAPSASRLNLPVLETPASVDIVTQQTMQEQGYRTTSEIAKGAVGVLDVNSSGAPANFSMRGFSFGAVNVLYNGISTGVASDTTRVMDTANLDQVEFLKGPSALMSGIMAIGGSVNYVSRQPTTGPIQNELDLSVDSLGTLRSHYGSGGSTPVEGLDYRIDVTGSKIDSFIDGDYRNLGDLSAQFNYRMTNTFKTFVAIEYKQDEGHAYWGTPLVPTSFAGPYAIGGVVSGSAVNTFSGTTIGPLTVELPHPDNQLQRRRQLDRRARALAAQRIRMDAAQGRHGQRSGLLFPSPTTLDRQRDLCLRRRIGFCGEHHRSRPFLRNAKPARGRQQPRLLVGFAAVRHG